MRYLYLFYLLLLSQLSFSQNMLPIVWKTDRGIVDTGQMERLPINFAEDDPIKLVLKYFLKR